MTDNEVVAALVRSMRKQQGMTLPELAKKAKVSKGIVSRIENEKGNPCLSTLTALAKALGYPTYWLIDELNVSGKEMNE